MKPRVTVSVAEFKAQCLDYIDRLDQYEIGELVLTKRGRIVAIVKSPQTMRDALSAAYGSLRGSVLIAEGVDLTAPIFDGGKDAELGILPR